MIMCNAHVGYSSFVLYTEVESVGGPTKHLQWPGCAVRTGLSAQSTTLGQVPPGLNGPGKVADVITPYSRANRTQATPVSVVMGQSTEFLFTS